MLGAPYFFNVTESMSLLDLSEAEVRERISDGRLFAKVIDGAYSIPRFALVEYASRKFDAASLSRIDAATE